MSFHVPFNGIEIRCDTIAEAMALARQAVSVSTFGSGATGNRRSSNRADAAVERRRVEQAERRLRFLVAVHDAGEKGISGHALVKIVKCNGVAGLGTVKQVAERLLAESGLDLSETTTRQRKGNEKLWHAGPQIRQGIRALEVIVKDGRDTN